MFFSQERRLMIFLRGAASLGLSDSASMTKSTTLERFTVMKKQTGMHVLRCLENLFYAVCVYPVCHTDNCLLLQYLFRREVGMWQLWDTCCHVASLVTAVHCPCGNEWVFQQNNAEVHNACLTEDFFPGSKSNWEHLGSGTDSQESLQEWRPVADSGCPQWSFLNYLEQQSF